MGSHIDVFFPHAVERTIDAVRERLNSALSLLKGELALIHERGQFSQNTGEWSIWFDEGAITGEGPVGLSISVHELVAELTSVERFTAVQRSDQGIQTALRRVFEEVASAFGAGGRLAVAAGGYGDTDHAADLALGGADFVDVCNSLEVVAGSPACSWAILDQGEQRWYLSTPDAEPRAAAGPAA